MSVLDLLDATRLCESPIEPTAWAMAPPAPRRRALPEPRRAEFSWLALARNPQAMLVSGVVAAGLVRDALLRIVGS